MPYAPFFVIQSAAIIGELDGVLKPFPARITYASFSLDQLVDELAQIIDFKFLLSQFSIRQIVNT